MRLTARTTQAIVVWSLAMSLASSEALASGVGASIYVQRPTVQQASCHTGTCPPASGCSGCQRLGFACVDHATPPPCTAEGGCYPNRNTFGYTQTRWRTWPGAQYNTGAPQPAEAGDLLPPVEEPAAEEEDKQAPPPIEDSEVPAESDLPLDGGLPGGADEDGPGIEVTLPPLPDGPLPVPRPQAPGFQNNAPPALPFGFDNRRESPQQGDWTPPPAPFTKMPAHLPKPAANEDAPPPLPRGFTATPPEQLIRRLPTARPAGRYDGQVRQASAQASVR